MKKVALFVLITLSFVTRGYSFISESSGPGELYVGDQESYTFSVFAEFDYQGQEYYIGAADDVTYSTDYLPYWVDTKIDSYGRLVLYSTANIDQDVSDMQVEIFPLYPENDFYVSFGPNANYDEIVLSW